MSAELAVDGLELAARVGLPEALTGSTFTGLAEKVGGKGLVGALRQALGSMSGQVSEYVSNILPDVSVSGAGQNVVDQLRATGAMELPAFGRANSLFMESSFVRDLAAGDQADMQQLKGLISARNGDGLVGNMFMNLGAKSAPVRMEAFADESGVSYEALWPSPTKFVANLNGEPVTFDVTRAVLSRNPRFGNQLVLHLEAGDDLNPVGRYVFQPDGQGNLTQVGIPMESEGQPVHALYAMAQKWSR